jgi:hypothetical protein
VRFGRPGLTLAQFRTGRSKIAPGDQPRGIPLRVVLSPGRGGCPPGGNQSQRSRNSRTVSEAETPSRHGKSPILSLPDLVISALSVLGSTEIVRNLTLPSAMAM